MSDAWGFETRQIHVGGDPDPTTGARAVPIYQTTSYEFRDSAHAANLFALAEVGNIYTRIMNPTQGAFEARLNALEGGCTTAIGIPGTLVVGSGQAAEMLAITDDGRGRRPRRRLAVAVRRHVQPAALHAAEARHRGHVRRRPRRPRAVAQRRSTEHQAVLRRGAVEPEERRLRHRGRVEGGPRGRCAADRRQHRADAVPDPPDRVGRRHRRALADQVHRRPRHVDRRRRSSTAARSTSANGRFPNFTEPDPSYHGLPYWPALGHGAFIIKARVQGLRDTGAAISPFNAFLFLQGLETLSLRMERHFANAAKVAEFLQGRDEVESVIWAGLPSSPWHERATKYGRGKGYGSIISFIIKGGKEAGTRFVEALELHSHVANIGDVRSLVIQPATTTHSQLTEEEQAIDRRLPRSRAPQRRARVDRRHHRRPRSRLPRRQGLNDRRQLASDSVVCVGALAIESSRCPRAGAGMRAPFGRRIERS